MEASTILADTIPILQLPKPRLREGSGLAKVAQMLFPFCKVTSEASWWKKNSVCSTKIIHKLLILYYTEKLAKDSFIFVKESPPKISSDSPGDAINIIKQ